MRAKCEPEKAVKYLILFSAKVNSCTRWLSKTNSKAGEFGEAWITVSADTMEPVSGPEFFRHELNENNVTKRIRNTIGYSFLNFI